MCKWVKKIKKLPDPCAQMTTTLQMRATITVYLAPNQAFFYIIFECVLSLEFVAVFF